MKFSCQEHLIPGNSISKKLKWLEINRFHGIELWAFDLKERLKTLKKEMLGSAIQVSSLCGGYEGDLFDSSPSSRKKAIDGVKKLIYYASELQCPGVIIVPSFGTAKTLGVLQPLPTASRDDVQLFSSVLMEIGEVANDHQVNLYVEPINRYESHLFNKVQEITDILDKLNNPALAVLGDLFHMNVEANSIYRELDESLSQIKYIHLADSNRQVPGKGHINFQNIIHILEKNQFEGFLSFECFIDNPDELIQSKNYLQQLIT